jgi:chaperonin cofactor prefoldin
MPLPAYNKEQERQMLMNQIQILEAQLKLTKKRLEELRG